MCFTCCGFVCNNINGIFDLYSNIDHLFTKLLINHLTE